MNILMKQALADFLSSDLVTAFDLDTAVGNQLDVIAKYIGVPRNSNIPSGVQFFGYALAGGGGSVNGYNLVGAASLNGFIYLSVTNSTLPTTAFSDVQFLFVLKLQIALNHFDGTFSYIQRFLQDFFPGQITVTDNLDMTMTYTVSPNVPVSTAVLANFLPRPMGVGITISTTDLSSARVLSDGTTQRVLSDGSTVRVTA
jgi:hypothetical protein